MENKNDKRLILLTFIIVVVNLVFVYYTYQSNKRSEDLFIGQNKPLIDVTPIGIKQIEIKQKKADGTEVTISKQAITTFSVVNYSGFVARRIGIDVKYGEGNDWISEWRKAAEDEAKKKKKYEECKAKKDKEYEEEKGVVKDKFYPTTPKLFIQELESGKTKDKDFEWEPRYVIGAFLLEEQVCADPNGNPVLVRVTWENEKGHVFDEIHEYELVCTKVKSGRSFTFIPKGIISQKD